MRSGTQLGRFLRVFLPTFFYPTRPVIIAGRPKAVLQLRFYLSLCAVLCCAGNEATFIIVPLLPVMFCGKKK